MAAQKSTPKHLFTLKTATAVFTSKADPENSFDFSDHITSLLLQPSAASATPVISGRKFAGQTDWAAQLGLVQDLDKDGFLRWLIEHEGETFTAHFTFADGSDPVKIDLTAVAAGIGGNANDANVAQSSVTLPADGKPEWVPIP